VPIGFIFQKRASRTKGLGSGNIVSFLLPTSALRSTEATCVCVYVTYEEEDTCMSYEEEDTCPLGLPRQPACVYM
jgi:hypothetical protein